MQTAIANVPRGNLTSRAAVEALFRQKRLFLYIAGAILLTTAIFTVLKHKQYRSEMKFLVQNTRGNVVITPERTNVASDVSETQVNSALEILHSLDGLDPAAGPDWSKVPVGQRSPSGIRRHEK